MDIPRVNAAIEEYDDNDLNLFLELVSQKPLGFLQNAFSQLDPMTRHKLHNALKGDLLSVSPSRWDCPIQKNPFFSAKKTSTPPRPFVLPEKRQINRVLVVVPSLSVDIEELKKIEGATYYQERQLFNILALQDPHLHIIYVTALPLHPSIVNYYLSFLSDVPHPDDRLTLFSTFDGSQDKTLTQKILERPRLQEKIKNTINKYGSETQDRSMICFIPTKDEHSLAKNLGIKLEASPTDVQFWGSKTGSRKIFQSCGIPLPEGCFESIWNEETLVQRITELWDSNPSLSRVVIKLNEGFSGEGYALLDLRPIASRLYANYKFTSRSRNRTQEKPFTEQERNSAIQDEFRQLRFQSTSESWESFSQKIPILGCIVEEWIEGKGKQSPSIQGHIHPDGNVEIISTHEQVLGGADDQVYLGCRFPCDPAYRIELHDYCLKVGRFLAEKGALGRYGIDFIATPDKPWDFEHWHVYALEINLRQGGTTHPYETLRALAQGNYSSETGLFLSSRNEEKYYIASDNVRKEAYCGLLPSDLMTIIRHHDLMFDDETHTGVVFHLMGALSQYGKMGMTCIGNSYEQAEELYEKVVSVLDEETNHPFSLGDVQNGSVEESAN